MNLGGSKKALTSNRFLVTPKRLLVTFPLTSNSLPCLNNFPPLTSTLEGYLRAYLELTKAGMGLGVRAKFLVELGGVGVPKIDGAQNRSKWKTANIALKSSRPEDAK